MDNEIKDIIKSLIQIENKYKNIKPYTFELNIYAMARDCKITIETLLNKIEQMKQENNIEKELYENCMVDITGELVNHSNSCYLRESEESTMKYFKDKWGLTEPMESDK